MKSAPFVVLAALLLSLESPAAEPGTGTTCKAGKCDVVITMSAGCGSGIKVAPDPIVVAKGETVEINWVISAERWEFDGANGIVIFQPDEAFQKLKSDRKIHRHKHQNKKPGSFKYDINLVGPEGKCKLDPTIVDQ